MPNWPGVGVPDPTGNPLRSRLLLRRPSPLSLPFFAFVSPHVQLPILASLAVPVPPYGLQALHEEVGDCSRHVGYPGPAELAATSARLATQRAHTLERLAAWGVLRQPRAAAAAAAAAGPAAAPVRSSSSPGPTSAQRRSSGGRDLRGVQDQGLGGIPLHHHAPALEGGDEGEEEDNADLALAMRLSLQEQDLLYCAPSSPAASAAAGTPPCPRRTPPRPAGRGLSLSLSSPTAAAAGIARQASAPPTASPARNPVRDTAGPLQGQGRAGGGPCRGGGHGAHAYIHAPAACASSTACYPQPARINILPHSTSVQRRLMPLQARQQLHTRTGARLASRPAGGRRRRRRRRRGQLEEGRRMLRRARGSS